MSRNLCDTSCVICSADWEQIKLEEAPRPATKADCGFYFDGGHRGRGYRDTLIVAHAICTACGAKYLAWIESEIGDPMWHRKAEEDGRPFVDLSFRSTFNDEPGPADLPSPERLIEIMRAEMLAEAAGFRAQAAQLIKTAQDAERKAISPTSYWEAYRRA